MKKLAIVFLLIMVAFVAFAQSETETAKVGEWKPTKQIELVVGSAAGGGADLHARTFAEIAYKYGWISEPMQINYRTGATGGVAYQYLMDNKESDYILMIGNTSYGLAGILNDAPVKAEDIGFIAIMATDEYLGLVHKDSPWQTMQEFLDAMKANPGKISISGGLTAAPEEVGYINMCKLCGVEGTYVAFNGQSDAMKALLGKHLDFAILTPAASKGQLASGDFRPLCNFCEEEVTDGLLGLAPSMRSMGYDVTIQLMRLINCTPNMSAAAQAFYRDLVVKVMATQDWKDYIAANQLHEWYVDGPEAKKIYCDKVAAIAAAIN